jgi:hypothetical protein
MILVGGGKNMSIGITDNNYGYTYSSSGTSKGYKAVEKEELSNLMLEEAMMTPEQKMLYELLGGREAHMRNVMRNYNSDGDFVGPNGDVVAGMLATGVPESERNQLIDVSEEYRQKMFDMAKEEFINEKGVANGDTTNRSSVYREYQLSIDKKDRLKGTYSLEQYEKAYNKALYNAVKAANPNWKQGQSFDKSILTSVTRESVESTLVKSGNKLVKTSIDYTV